MLLDPLQSELMDLSPFISVFHLQIQLGDRFKTFENKSLTEFGVIASLHLGI